LMSRDEDNAVSFTDLNPQKVLHDSGAAFASFDRETMQYILDQRRWYIDVDRVEGGVYFLIPRTPHWDDGTPLTAQEASTALRIIQEACTHWHLAAYIEHQGPESKGPTERKTLA
jgi:hypothetical protein